MESVAQTPVTSALIVDVLQRAAGKIGAILTVEPEWGCVGQVRYKSGVCRYFRLSTLDLNPMGASEIARDKGYARFFLAKMGHPVAEGNTFLSTERAAMLRRPERGGVDAAWSYAEALGLPVFVKPNSLSRGVGVAKANTREEFRRAAQKAFEHDRVIVVEKAVTGKDYRLVVLDGVVISAYERLPLAVTGNGGATIEELLVEKQMHFAALERETVINRSDFRLLDNLHRAGLSYDSVLENGREVRLLDNANLSAGGTSIDVTEVVHDEFRAVSAKIAHDMGLRLVGVDLMVNGDITQAPQEGAYWVIEVNSAPGLDHYASMGERQKRIVDDLYLKVLIAMERPQEHISVSGRDPQPT